jgi:hypothetical protein
MVLNFLLKIIPVIFILFSISDPAFSQSKSSETSPVFIPVENASLEISSPVRIRNYETKKDSFDLPGNDSLMLKNDPSGNKQKISIVRLGIVSGVSLSILGGLYYRMKTAWWNDGNARFHIYYNYTYIDNVDKIGHLYGGALFTECFGLGLKWSGLDDESSLLYGAFLSSLVYTGIEMKDGFAPDWGFDPVDLGGSLIGAFYPYIQKKIPFLESFNLKYSYYPSNSDYFKRMNAASKNNQFFNDDYEGQTFWLTANIKNLLPDKIDSFMPDFLNIACGVSVENLSDPNNKHRVYVISPDIDLVKLFKPDSEFLKALLRLFNYIHIPLPALRVSPSLKGYVLYLKP